MYRFRKGPSLPGWVRLEGCATIGLGAAGLSNCAAVDFSQPWNPSTPLPQFITHGCLDPRSTAVAKYRSGVGHPFSDNSRVQRPKPEILFGPVEEVRGQPVSLPLFAPATGTIPAVVPEEQVLSNGDIRGNQVTIDPDGFPAFGISAFFTSILRPAWAPAPTLTRGIRSARDMRESVDCDMAIGAAWNATQVSKVGQSTAPPGSGFSPPRPLADPSIGAFCALRHHRSRRRGTVPLAYRNAHPGQL